MNGYQIFYTFGLSSNAVLRRDSEALLAHAVAAYEQARHEARPQEARPEVAPQRLFEGFWYQAGSWPYACYVIAKAEANAQGPNRRFVVSNRPGAALFPEATYDEDAGRGESENRNKELKCGFGMDRLSDHRFLANYFRLYLHAAAMNLLVRLRRFVAEPVPVPPTTSHPEEAAAAADLPPEALTGTAWQRHFRFRRQRDPLGEGQPCTWRTLLIKVAVEVVASSRRVWVRLSSSWPPLAWYRRVCERVAGGIAPSAATSG